MEAWLELDAAEMKFFAASVPEEWKEKMDKFYSKNVGVVKHDNRRWETLTEDEQAKVNILQFTGGEISEMRTGRCGRREGIN